MIRALIADDEAPARRRLRRLLEAHPGIEVCGEAASGPETLLMVAQLRPAVIFLDIEMPGATGIEVAASLPAPAPRIIFVTAWDHYAVEAFRLHALDYVLKPVAPERLAESIRRLDAEPPASTLPFVQRLLVRSGDHCIVVACSEIVCFTSAQGHTRLYGQRPGGGQFDYYLDLTLNELEARIDPLAFIRVSRSALLGFSAITAIRPIPPSGGEAELSDGRVFAVSRRRWPELVKALAGTVVPRQH